MGLGKKVFTAGEVLAAADVNGYLMDQAVMVFASAEARSASISSPSAGMTSFRTDGTALEVYDGANWVGVNSVGGTTTVNSSNVINTNFIYGDNIQLCFC